MQRVASLFLPQLPIERLCRTERPATPPDGTRPGGRFPEPLEEDPGACSVPRGGGWRPGARWARDGALARRSVSAALETLPAHQRPTMREMGRRSESAEHPFKAMRPDDGGSSGPGAPARAALAGSPIILVARTGQRDVVTAACPAARALGLVPGMAAAHARALVAGLTVSAAEPDADRAVLDRLALHAARQWTPTACAAPPDGLWLDLTGTTHLFGGEEHFCRRVLGFLARLGFSARIAVAGSPGAAHALARFGSEDIAILPPGGENQAIAGLPLAALRLEPDALEAGARFGLERIGDLYPMPRGPLARRLGLRTVERLDQARGRLAEPIVPVVPQDAPVATRRLLEPIATAESIAQVIRDLADDLVSLLRGRGLGARILVLTADRVDGAAQHVTIGASRATRNAGHLTRMLALRIAGIDPGFGIEAMHLAALHHEPLGAQPAGVLVEARDRAPDLAPLIDRLAVRAGPSALFRMSSRESDVPERAARRVQPLSAASGWPAWSRPVRLLRRPEALSNVIALLPDHPPRRFTWRRRDYRVVAGDGPERVHGEWWRSPKELWAVRDYFRVEADDGARFWLFRRGDGVEAPTGDLSWYMHGLFG